jgi:hypothetical protein
VNAHADSQGASRHYWSDAEALLRYADVAMYQAKRSGGGFAVYQRAQNVYSAQRGALLSRMLPAEQDALPR